jgi:hypothetical protein
MKGMRQWIRVSQAWIKYFYCFLLSLPLLLMRLRSIVAKHLTLETLDMVKDLLSLIRGI